MRKCKMVNPASVTPDPNVWNCNCTESLLTVASLRSDIETYKTEVLIIHWVIAVVLAILVVCIIVMYYWIRKLQRVVNALDPMSKYKKVGPSLYIRKGRRETSSISSSFQHFNANVENNIYSNPENIRPTRGETSKRSEVGTLDRNFFTDSNFNFNNPLSQRSMGSEQEHSLNKRKISDPEVREAAGRLDEVIY